MKDIAYLYLFMAFGFCFHGGVIVANLFYDSIKEVIEKIVNKNN